MAKSMIAQRTRKNRHVSRAVGNRNIMSPRCGNEKYKIRPLNSAVKGGRGGQPELRDFFNANIRSWKPTRYPSVSSCHRLKLQRRKMPQFRGLSKRNFFGRGINNLQAAQSVQVIDSSFEKFYLRQALRLSPSSNSKPGRPGVQCQHSKVNEGNRNDIRENCT